MNGADIISIIILIAIVIAVVVYLLHWLYRRSSKDVSFVRTGFGGEKVVMGGGALVLPIVHQITEVSMNTLRLEVHRVRERSLITQDHMRAEVSAEFFVRVKPAIEAVSVAAATLGSRTMNAEGLRELVEGRFVNAMSLVAAQMTLKDMHEHRGDYITAVQEAVRETLVPNGLELENASLTSLDQTDIKLFNPSNTFDTDGLTQLTIQIENQRKKRNDTEQDTMVSIRNKNLEAEQRALQIDRDSDYARLEQEREVSTRRAQQKMEIALERITRERETEEAEIRAREEVERTRIAQLQAIEAARIAQEQDIEALEIQRKRSLEIEERERDIAIAAKTSELSRAEAEAETVRATRIEATEKVNSIREFEIAERRKHIELTEASQRAEREAIELTVVAEAEKKAAELRAKAEEFNTAAMRLRFETEAEGARQLNEAENLRSPESRRSALKTKLIEHLEGIIRESVKPIEQIESIKVMHVDGLPGFSGPLPGGAGGSGGVPVGGGPSDSMESGDMSGANGAVHAHAASLADSIVTSALRYRAQAPLVDKLLSEIGLDGGAANQIKRLLSDEIDPQQPF